MLTISIALNVLLFFAFAYWMYTTGELSRVIRRLKRGYRRISRPGIVYPRLTDFYCAKTSLLEVLPRTRDEIIFLGDSMTYAMHWNELLENPRVRNRGLPGDRTELILSRLDRITSESPRKIFLMAGINDLGMAIEVPDIVSHYKAILEQFTAEIPRTEIYVQSVLPVNNALYAVDINNEDVTRLNEQLKMLAAQYGATYIDLHPLFTDRNGHLRRRYTSHGIHLNGKGYLIWKDAIESYVHSQPAVQRLPIRKLSAIGLRSSV